MSKANHLTTLFVFPFAAKPVNVHFVVNGSNAASRVIYLSSNEWIDLSCIAEAQPLPTFQLTWPDGSIRDFQLTGGPFDGIAYNLTLRIQSMSCLHAGTYRCSVSNAMGQSQTVSATLRFLGEAS